MWKLLSAKSVTLLYEVKLIGFGVRQFEHVSTTRTMGNLTPPCVQRSEQVSTVTVTAAQVHLGPGPACAAVVPRAFLAFSLASGAIEPDLRPVPDWTSRIASGATNGWVCGLALDRAFYDAGLRSGGFLLEVLPMRRQTGNH